MRRVRAHHSRCSAARWYPLSARRPRTMADRLCPVRYAPRRRGARCHGTEPRRREPPLRAPGSAPYRARATIIVHGNNNNNNIIAGAAGFTPPHPPNAGRVAGPARARDDCGRAKWAQMSRVSARQICPRVFLISHSASSARGCVGDGGI